MTKNSYGHQILDSWLPLTTVKGLLDFQPGRGACIAPSIDPTHPLTPDQAFRRSKTWLMTLR